MFALLLRAIFVVALVHAAANWQDGAFHPSLSAKSHPACSQSTFFDEEEVGGSGGFFYQRSSDSHRHRRRSSTTDIPARRSLMEEVWAVEAEQKALQEKWDRPVNSDNAYDDWSFEAPTTDLEDGSQTGDEIGRESKAELKRSHSEIKILPHRRGNRK